MTIILLAIPMFVVFLVLEAVSFTLRPDDDEVGYEVRDTVTSLSMGLGSRVWGLLWDVSALLGLTAAALLAPWHLDMHNVSAWVLLLVAEDLCYYAFHRANHRIRILWAGHVVHHSSRHYNFSTALRQEWTGFASFAFWLPLALVGFPVWAIYLQQSVSLIYQFFLHTERIDRLPRGVEAVLNTPSHHRVHHGRNKQYLDKNYGGILIVWDRLLHTFEAEVEHPDYGLTKNIETYNPLRVAFHEWYSIGHDVRHASSWVDRVRYVVAGPGWAPVALPQPAA